GTAVDTSGLSGGDYNNVGTTTGHYLNLTVSDTDPSSYTSIVNFNFSISGTKFEDLTGNGKSSDDVAWSHGPGTIYVDSNQNSTFESGEKSTTTDANGNWTIPGLTLADVDDHIREVVPAGSEQTGTLVQTVGNPGSGGTDTGNDFTNFVDFSISGTTFDDLTRNGTSSCYD